MLNLKFIQENKDTVIRKLAVKNFDAKELVEKIIALDNERKNLQKESDNKQSEMNSISKQIGSLMKEGLAVMPDVLLEIIGSFVENV